MCQVRLLPFARVTGPTNMALDEAVLESVQAGDAPPTLRVYGWRGRWLSIGMAQSIQDVDRDACRAAGVGVLRRPSGGTAVLHERQIGWTLVVPTGHALAIGDIVAAYRAQSTIALGACEIMGVSASAVSPESAHRAPADSILSVACFGGLAPYEIVAADGRKLIGWGQVRRRGVVLHHSVASLRFDAAALARLLACDRTRLADALTAQVSDFTNVSGRRVSAIEVTEALIAAHRGGGLCLRPGRVSPAEARRARALVREKYACEGWTARR